MASTPIRVCYVISQFHPRSSGAERQALAQGAELVRRGHQVHVVTRRLPGCPDDEIVFGLHVHRWIRPVAIGPLFGLTFVSSLIQALRRLRPHYDLIHTHQGLWEAIATGLGRDLLRDAPVLVQPASAGYYGEADELSRTRGFAILRRLSLRNLHWAAISAEIERQWIALGVPPDRIVRMASGVDATHFAPGSSPLDSSLPARPRAIFTGRLHPQKNLDVLIDVWPAVHKATGASLVLVGDGPERSRLEQLARSLHIAHAIHFAGPVADPADYLRACNLFLLPSVAEGMSNSLLEAMSTGLPSLASRIGGNVDLLEHADCGILLDPADKPAWQHELIRLLNDSSEARRLGANARQRVEAEFSLPVVVDRYLTLYRALLAESAPSTVTDA